MQEVLKFKNIISVPLPPPPPRHIDISPFLESYFIKELLTIYTAIIIKRFFCSLSLHLREVELVTLSG